MIESAGRDTTLVASSRPPQPNLQKRSIGSMLGKRQEGGGGRDLKEGDDATGIDALHPGQVVYECGFGDGVRLAGSTGQLDALMEANEVERGIDVQSPAG